MWFSLCHQPLANPEDIQECSFSIHRVSTWRLSPSLLLSVCCSSQWKTGSESRFSNWGKKISKYPCPSSSLRSWDKAKSSPVNCTMVQPWAGLTRNNEHPTDCCQAPRCPEETCRGDDELRETAQGQVKDSTLFWAGSSAGFSPPSQGHLFVSSLTQHRLPCSPDWWHQSLGVSWSFASCIIHKP